MLPVGKLKVGDPVRVRCDILKPRFGWGSTSPGEVGTIASVDDRRCRVKFSRDEDWKGLLKELEPVIQDADRAVEGILDMYEQMFNAKRFEDVVFELADGREGAHKVVLSAASEPFAAMFEQPMQECRSGKVELATTTAVTMRVFLRLLYTGRVDPADWQSNVSSPGGTDEPERNAEGPHGEEEYEDAVDDPTDADEHEDSDEADEADSEEQNAVNPAVEDDAPEAHGSSCKGSGRRMELPLETLCDVAALAQKYMVHNVLQLTIEALKVRLQKAAVDKNVTVFEEIASVAINMGLGAVRTAAVQTAKKSKAIWKRYESKQLRSEVQLELQAVWPPPRPPRKPVKAWLS